MLDLQGPLADLVTKITEACQPYWQFRDNDIHIPESTRFARMLLAAHPEADPAIVLPAILMHDNGYANVPPELLFAGLKDAPVGFSADVTRLHEIEGVKIARAILEKLEVSEPEIVEICAIIDGHDSRETALSLNDQLVKDADKLWRYTISAANLAGRGWMKMRPEAFNHYVTERIDRWLFTDAAKRLAHAATADTQRQLEHPIEGVVFMLMREGQLLIEKRSPTKRLLPNAFSIPGGHIEPGESIGAALARELQEELGLVAEKSRFVCTLHSWAQTLRRLHYFAIEAWTGELVMQEAAELHWIDIDAVNRLDLPADQIALQEYQRIYG